MSRIDPALWDSPRRMPDSRTMGTLAGIGVSDLWESGTRRLRCLLDRKNPNR
jgi:hypothetical protein